MPDNPYAVVIVYSTSHALRIEKLLQQQAITCKLIPVPRHISTNCGICIRILLSDVEAVSQAIALAGVEIEGIREI